MSDTQEQAGPYYVIYRNYCGPNRADRDPNATYNREHYTIETEPGHENLSGNICIEGPLGQTNDWSAHAMGEYETLEEARTAIDEDEEGEVREDYDGRIIGHHYHDESGVVEVWYPVNQETGWINVDWDDIDNLQVTLAEGVQWLYCTDTGNEEAYPAWQGAALALGVDPHDRDHRDAIQERLEDIGWETEEASHAGWDAWYLVGKPPAEWAIDDAVALLAMLGVAPDKDRSALELVGMPSATIDDEDDA